MSDWQQPGESPAVAFGRIISLAIFEETLHNEFIEKYSQKYRERCCVMGEIRNV